MKTKLVKTDIKLETQADCYKALLDGYVLVEKNFVKFKLVDGFIIELSAKERVPLTFNYPTSWQVYEEVPWYEHIPKDGILCWVSDSDKDSKVNPHVVTGVKQAGNSVRFITKNRFVWVYATPLTEEEVKKYILKSC